LSRRPFDVKLLKIGHTFMPPSVRSQIRQTKPFSTPEAEAFVTLLRVSYELEAQLTDVLREYDVTRPQFNVLRILRGAGERGLASGDIGARMVTHDSDITRLIDRMESRGLVKRERNAEDRRVVTVVLSAQGRSLVDSLDEPVRQLHDRQFVQLTKAELKTLVALLEKTRARSP
jgi:DNA-binding MarR family transcriptional regulator